ncbi:protein rogdi-like [Paramacrobiotus metropolitanus]|uniref:protein rogdi-like n=1 Tax=Paramacrobiotus metropolitanus TaxID=2943436 RepID=UPI002445D56C|nr:protein rogdi-like [Paramacrobiotus metropolitanus]
MELDEEITEVDEIDALEREYRWFLRTEVRPQIGYLQGILTECKERLPPASFSDRQKNPREERFVVSPTNGGDFLKCIVTLTGSRITAADVTFRMATAKNPGQMMKLGIPPEAPYQLQQLQDALNAVSDALAHLAAQDAEYEFQTAEEVIKIIQPAMAQLSQARSTLIVPKKRSFDELKGAFHRRHFVPPLPADMSASFYLQAHKLVFALYQILPGTGKFDCYQGEVSIPWLTESLVLLTVALQTCQQLLDKMNIFMQNLDLSPKPFD